MLTYAWSVEWSPTALPAGSGLNDAGLHGRTTPQPTFVPDVDGTYLVELRVHDTAVDSPPVVVSVLAVTPNVPPNAHAGPDQSTLLGMTVFLDGQASTDPDHRPQPLTFTWSVATVPPDSTVHDGALVEAHQPQASFVPDVPGLYALTLRVTDGAATS